MGRQLLSKSFLLVLLLMMAFVPLDSVNLDSLEQEDVVKMSSSLSASFSNGPSENDVIKGTHTLTFSTSGTGTVDSI